MAKSITDLEVDLAAAGGVAVNVQIVIANALIELLRDLQAYRDNRGV